ncbi:hypothetical protein STEG23_030758 [Scotinomys teguina]
MPKSSQPQLHLNVTWHHVTFRLKTARVDYSQSSALTKARKLSGFFLRHPETAVAQTLKGLSILRHPETAVAQTLKGLSIPHFGAPYSSSIIFLKFIGCGTVFLYAVNMRCYHWSIKKLL